MKRWWWWVLALAACDSGTSTPEGTVDDATVVPSDRDGGDLDGARPDARPPRVDASLRDQGRSPDVGRPDAAERDAHLEADAAIPVDAAPDMGPPPDCSDLALPLGAWRNPFDSPITVSAGDPHHSAVEPVVNPGQPFTFDGKFAYGVFSEDLEGETVEVWLRQVPCGAWERFANARTNNDGRISLAHPGFPEVGTWDFRLRVPGDDSRAVGRVRVVPPGTKAVIFDVDGTLTIGDSEIFQEILLGQDPELYPGGPDVVGRWAEQGYFVVYLTGRPYFLNPASRRWLERHGFPDGPLRTTDSLAEAVPNAGGVQAYKLAWIRHLEMTAGLDFVAAYGNAPTDICAYAQSGIDVDATWIIGPHGGEACDGFPNTHAVVDYPSHLPALADLPPAR